MTDFPIAEDQMSPDLIDEQIQNAFANHFPGYTPDHLETLIDEIGTTPYERGPDCAETDLKVQKDSVKSTPDDAGEGNTKESTDEISTDSHPVDDKSDLESLVPQLSDSEPED